MSKKFLGTVFAAAVMLAGTLESYGGETMKSDLLTVRETAIVDLGAAVARGDQKNLAIALNRGFDNGLTLAEAKEFIGQLYAYCGFPRALNAAATLQSVVKEREAAKRPVPAGKAPSAPPKGKAIDFGTDNQTKLCGREVKGGLFDFHPQLDEYLKDLIEVRGSLLFGLYEEEQLIGISLGKIKHWCGGTEYYIEELCVRNDHQGKGYGKEFFALIEGKIKERGIHTIYLMTDRNQPAYEFYKRIGFREMPELTSFFKTF